MVVANVCQLFQLHFPCRLPIPRALWRRIWTGAMANFTNPFRIPRQRIPVCCISVACTTHERLPYGASHIEAILRIYGGTIWSLASAINVIRKLAKLTKPCVERSVCVIDSRLHPLNFSDTLVSWARLRDDVIMQVPHDTLEAVGHATYICVICIRYSVVVVATQYIHIEMHELAFDSFFAPVTILAPVGQACASPRARAEVWSATLLDL